MTHNGYEWYQTYIVAMKFLYIHGGFLVFLLPDNTCVAT